MALVTVSDTTLTDIADAIRSKNGTEDTYKPSQMPDAIEAISGGGITPTGTIEITQNGVVDVTNYASAEITVNVITWSRIIGSNPTKYYKNNTTLSNGVFTLTANGGWTVTVNPSPIMFTYADLVGKTIRISADYTITGMTTGSLIIGPCLYDNAVLTGATRSNYPSDNSSIASQMSVTDSGGTLSYEFVLSSDIMNTSTIDSTDYVGIFIYLHANSGCTATLTNINMEVKA